MERGCGIRIPICRLGPGGNNPASFPQQYRTYLLGVLRDQLSFGEVPIKLYLHRRRQDDQRDDIEQPDDAPEDAGNVPDEVASNEVEDAG